jgi:hypothetical protein
MTEFDQVISPGLSSSEIGDFLYVDSIYLFIHSFIGMAGLEFLILLPQSLDCWDYRHAVPCSASIS